VQRPLKYFVFNKEDDFQRGWKENVVYIPEEGLRLAPGAEGDGGIFYSRLLDSREKGSLWHRIEVVSESLGDASLRFTFYAAEERKLRLAAGERDLAEFLLDAELTAAEKEKQLRPYLVKTVYNPKDALLHEARGRYLWFRVEFFGTGTASPRVRRLKITLAAASWLEYLPEIYQEDHTGAAFLERYLAIFASLHDGLEREIDRVARYFDPDVVEGEFLSWLAGWLDLDDVHIWTEDKLRRLIKNSLRLYKIRGTRQAVLEMAELYLGTPPFIIEYFQVENTEGEARSSGLISRLYGDNSYYFTVVAPEWLVPTPREYNAFLKIIDSAKPAHVEANVVVLKPYIFLDKYSYLGLNSVLGRYQPANLGGLAALPFAGVPVREEVSGG
jgi:phage tail-like protein